MMQYGWGLSQMTDNVNRYTKEEYRKDLQDISVNHYLAIIYGNLRNRERTRRFLLVQDKLQLKNLYQVCTNNVPKDEYSTIHLRL